MSNNSKDTFQTNELNDKFRQLTDEELPDTKNNNYTSIDLIINQYGYRKEVWLILISVFLCFILNGYLTTSFCSFILAYQKKFSLTNSQISILGTVFFITKFISSFSVGYQTHFLSRIVIIRLALFSCIISSIINALLLTYKILLFNQFINGLSAGIFEIASFNIACEYTPIKYRGWSMLSIWNGYNVGVLFPNLIMLVTMPLHQPEGLRITLLICSGILGLCGLFILAFLKDSPRNDIMNGKYLSAFDLLEKMKGGPLDEEEKDKIIKAIVNNKEENNDIRDIGAKSEAAGIKEVFEGEMRKIGIMLVIICFFGNIINDGFQLVLNLLLEKINNTSQSEEYNVLKENILINTIGLPSNFLIGIFTELKILGRRHTQAIGFFILSIFIFPVFFAPNNAYIYLIFFMFFTCITNMVNVYVSEIYPTKTRDLALGVIQAVGYFGSCISQFVFVYLNDWNFYICPIVFMVLCFVNSVLSMCLKVDTVGRPLDGAVIETKKKENYNAIIELGVKNNSGKDENINTMKLDNEEK